MDFAFSDQLQFDQEKITYILVDTDAKIVGIDTDFSRKIPELRAIQALRNISAASNLNTQKIDWLTERLKITGGSIPFQLDINVEGKITTLPSQISILDSTRPLLLIRALTKEKGQQETSDFLADNRDVIAKINHAIKSPLKSANAIVNIISDKDTHKSKIDIQLLESLKQSLEKIELLAEAVTSITTSISAKINFQKVDFDHICAYLEKKHKLQIQRSIDCDCKSDQHLLTIAIEELIQNAISNHPNQTPKIALSVRQEANNTIIELTDDSGGIDEKYLSKISSPFYRLKSYEESKGFGLGITKIKLLIEKLGGRLNYTNIEGGLKASISLQG